MPVRRDGGTRETSMTLINPSAREQQKLGTCQARLMYENCLHARRYTVEQ